MTKIAMYKDDNGRLLVIWTTKKANLIGEVFNNGVEKRGKWDNRATFYVKDGNATKHNVCKYFGFYALKEYWSRWA